MKCCLRASNTSRFGSIATSLSRAAVLVLTLLVAIVVYSAPAHALSGSLPIGIVQTSGNPFTCVGSHWFQHESTPMTCQSAQVKNCSNVTDIGFTFGYLQPIVPYLGTIVLLAGADGTIPSVAPGAELDYARDYYNAGYEIVQVAWDSAWELTDTPGQQNGPPPSIQGAACRPATLLNYVFTTPLLFTRAGNSHAGMCVQGASAGSAAVAYSLTYYGLGDDLDMVALLAGPPLSDIQQGCRVPPPPNAITICGGNQIGCHLGTDSPWSMDPGYLKPAVNGVRSWNRRHELSGRHHNLRGLKFSVVSDKYCR